MFLYKYIPNFPRTIARLKALPTIYIVYCRSFLNFAFLLKSLIFLFFSLLNSIKRKKRSQSRTNREFIRVNINFRESFRSSFSEANNHNSNRGNADRHRKRRNWPCNYAARNDCTDPPETLFLPVLRRSFQGTVDFSRKFLGQQLDVVAACIEAGWLTNWPRCATRSVDEQQKLVTLNPRAPRLPRTTSIHRVTHAPVST